LFNLGIAPEGGQEQIGHALQGTAIERSGGICFRERRRYRLVSSGHQSCGLKQLTEAELDLKNLESIRLESTKALVSANRPAEPSEPVPHQ